jgi:hypothetical protein
MTVAHTKRVEADLNRLLEHRFALQTQLKAEQLATP